MADGTHDPQDETSTPLTPWSPPPPPGGQGSPPLGPPGWDPAAETSRTPVGRSYDPYEPQHESGRWVVVTIAVMVLIVGVGLAAFFALRGDDQTSDQEPTPPPTSSHDTTERTSARLTEVQVDDLRAYTRRHNQLVLQGARDGDYRQLVRFDLAYQHPDTPFSMQRCREDMQQKFERTIKLTFPDFASLRPARGWRVQVGRYEGIRPRGRVYEFQTTIRKGEPGGPYDRFQSLRYVAWIGDRGPYMFKDCTLSD